MNSTTIHRMLSTKNIYALLFICVTHLGCSSSYCYQMEKGDADRPSSSSKETGISIVPGDRGNIQLMDKKVDKFLDEEDSYERSPKSKKPKVELPATKKNFKQGLPVADEEINEAIKTLGKSINISSIDKDYKAFLNKYGSIYGGGVDICGPTKNTADKLQYIVSMQRGFENRCKLNKMKEAKAKACWLIAGIDQGDEYYINLSGKKKDNIYSMSLDGKSKLFARNFLEFLDKFFEAYKMKTEEEDSEGEDS